MTRVSIPRAHPAAPDVRATAATLSARVLEVLRERRAAAGHTLARRRGQRTSHVRTHTHATRAIASAEKPGPGPAVVAQTTSGRGSL